MIAAALLAFREGLEAALILGIVLSILRRVGRRDQERMVLVGSGSCGSLEPRCGYWFVCVGHRL
jgi:high-affinity Fe2+/Pb2+ permease